MTFCHVFCARTLPSLCAFHKVPTHFVVTSHVPWYELSLAHSCLPRDVHFYPTGFPRPYILSYVRLRVPFCVLPTDIYPSSFNVLHAFPCTVTLSPLQSKIYCACLRQSTSTRKRNLWVKTRGNVRRNRQGKPVKNLWGNSRRKSRGNSAVYLWETSQGKSGGN